MTIRNVYQINLERYYQYVQDETRIAREILKKTTIIMQQQQQLIVSMRDFVSIRFFIFRIIEQELKFYKEKSRVVFDR